MASGGLLRASPGQRLRRLGQELLPYRSGTQMGACGHRCGFDAPSQPANSRPARRAIAIATALDIYRGGRRGFLPRGLCNTCPTAVRVLDRLCGWAGVTQALTGAAGRAPTHSSRCLLPSSHWAVRPRDPRMSAVRGAAVVGPARGSLALHDRLIRTGPN